MTTSIRSRIGYLVDKTWVSREFSPRVDVQWRIELALNDAEIDHSVCIAELSYPTVFSWKNCDDATVDAVTLAHALVHKGPPFCVIDARRQQEFLGQYHGSLSASARRW